MRLITIVLLADACTPTRPATTLASGASLSAQPLGRYNQAPVGFFPYPSGIVDFPFSQTDLWIGVPGGAGATATGGFVQSLNGHSRYQGAANVQNCY